METIHLVFLVSGSHPTVLELFVAGYRRLPPDVLLDHVVQGCKPGPMHVKHVLCQRSVFVPLQTASGMPVVRAWVGNG